MWSQSCCIKALPEAIAVFEHCVFDETLLQLKVAFNFGESDKELAKLFAVQYDYSLLLRERSAAEAPQPSDYIFIHVPLSIQLRASEREDGEAIRKVLLSTALGLDDVHTEMFQHVLRLAESDEAGSNLRGERLLHEARGGRVDVLHTLCAAHKAHSGATRTMALSIHAPMFSAMINLCKVMWDRKVLQRF